MEAAEAGAAIVHLHARIPEDDRPEIADETRDIHKLKGGDKVRF